MNYHIEITNNRNGRSFSLSPEGECRIVDGGLNGFIAPQFDVRFIPLAPDSSAGAYASVRRFTEREMALTFTYEKNETRRNILSVLDPEDVLTLSFSTDSGERLIDAVVSESVECDFENYLSVREMTVCLTAPEPFFRSAVKKRIIFRDAVPLAAFPVNTMTGAGTVSGILRNSRSAAVTNSGDRPAGVRIELTADGGRIESPVFSCGDSRIICNVTLNDGDTLVADTNGRNKLLMLNGSVCLDFTRDSRFFTLPVGESTISVSASSGEEYMKCTADITEYWYGVDI